jgi:hypothetical protein
MTTIRRINVSQVEGGDADNTDTTEIRPNGETAFYLDNNSKLNLMMFDGVRTHQKSKILRPGVLFGSNADAGDGSNADTIKLIPDATLFDEGSNQYLVVDPTGGVPGHIHLRAGGTQDSSSADLYIGGEQTFVRVSNTTDDVVIRTSTLGEGIIPHTWIFGTDGSLTVPGDIKSENAINIDINLSDSTLRRWQFGDNGTTSFPDGLILAPAGQNITMQSDQYSQLMYQNANVTVAPNTPTSTSFSVQPNFATLVVGYRDGNSDDQDNTWLWNIDGMTFPDNTVQTTAFVQREQIFTLDTGNIDYAPAAVDFNLLLVLPAGGYSETDPTSVTLPNGIPGQRLVIFNGYNLATLTVNPGPFGRDISSGVVAEFICSSDGWIPLYGTNSPT